MNTAPPNPPSSPNPSASAHSRSAPQPVPALKRYTWRGQNRAGQDLSGVLYGVDKDAVRAQLHQRGIIALTIRHSGEPWLRRVSTREVTRFLQELSTLYDSGVPLLRILDVQLYSEPKPYFRNIIQTIRLDVERGENLHTALRHHPKIFDELSCNLIASGEESGRLYEVLRNIVYSQEQRQRIRSQIQTALWYPIFVFLVAVLVWMGILTFIVPVFESVYLSQGRTLPWLTQLLIQISHGIRDNWPIGLLLIGLLAVLWAHGRHSLWQGALDRWRMRIPLIGRLLRQAWHAQFARTLGLLYQSGVPLYQALSTSAQTVSSETMRQSIRAVIQDVLNGHSLSLAMTQYSIFEPSLIQRVQIGEESGSLSTMLLQHAQHNEFLVEQGIKRLSSLIEPIMVVVVGVTVAVMVIALYLPILNIGM
ncbi:MAG: type II secretion system F family protein [Burkholderiaceae bacterium]